MTALFRRLRSGHDAEEGQSLIELAAILPLLLLLVLGSLEFGMVFDHHLSLEYATREGARTGSALANAENVAANCANVDKQIIAAVERVLTSPGSSVELADITGIRIYKAQANGAETAGKVNVWTYTPNAGPVVDGAALDFSPPATDAWPPCTRVNTNTNPDLLGVSITYQYGFRTAMGALLGDLSITMRDRTVMALNPL